MGDKKKILLIEFCNYEDYPIGGLLTFCKHLMLSFGDDLALIGITTSKKDPIGKWFKKEINGITYDFFALHQYDKSKTKHLLPDRLITFLLLKFYKKAILKIKIDNLFIQRQDILIAIKGFGFKNICFCFAGLENPLRYSKYWYAKYFANYYETITFNSFKNVKQILAAGDDEAIAKMVKESKGKITRKKVVKFPTRIDSNIFTPKDKAVTRRKLNLPVSCNVITTTGRLSWGKGWKFLIDSFIEFKKENLNSLFYFIGEGEDYAKIQAYIKLKNEESSIRLLGTKSAQEIADFLNASDVYIMGSYKEGWSTTLVEALATGVPICTTNFSSAKDIVTEGVTGYVVETHDIICFSKRMKDSLNLDTEALPLSKDVQRYSVSELRTDLLKNWPLI